MNNYRICNRCVMDNTSDKSISFDSSGKCNYCNEAYSKKDKVYLNNSQGEENLKKLINRLKEENREKKYDCLMGISGGLDSSYLAYLGAAKWGLRILAIHVDDGFDTEISKRNIERLCKTLNIELITINPDKEQFNMLIKAYMYSRVPNLAAPQDNVLFASIYKYMRLYGINTFLSGGNFALESILQKGNTHDAYDVRNIKHINRLFGEGKIDKLDFISNFQRDINRVFYGIRTIRPLDYIDYRRDQALSELNKYCEFEYYGSKHLENTLTKFVQVYWFYNKFGVDKRRSHLSSMIISNQITRDQALVILEEPPYKNEGIDSDIELILNQLNLSTNDFKIIMEGSPKQHTDYHTSIYNLCRTRALKIYRKVSR